MTDFSQISATYSIRLTDRADSGLSRLPALYNTNSVNIDMMTDRLAATKNIATDLARDRLDQATPALEGVDMAKGSRRAIINHRDYARAYNENVLVEHPTYG